MNLKMLKLIFLAGVVSILSACKVAVIVVEGGEVQSVRSGTCLAETVCIHEVADTEYTERFTAVPDAGWKFVKWNSGAGFLCEGQKDTTCNLSTEGAAGSPIEVFIDSDQMFYIQPIFVQVGFPVSAIQGSDGNEWAELNQFAGVPYEEISAACPGGVCSGVLNGYDMNGWFWATGEQVKNLLNFYTDDACGELPCLLGEYENYLAPALADGFQITGTWGLDADGTRVIASNIDGYTSDPELLAYAGIAFDEFNGYSCIAVGTGRTINCNGFGVIPVSGGWFMR